MRLGCCDEIFSVIFLALPALQAEKEPGKIINWVKLASFGRAPEGALFYGSSAV
jgi:hypothetical protein